jgi:hypothetical protein
MAQDDNDEKEDMKEHKTRCLDTYDELVQSNEESLKRELDEVTDLFDDTLKKTNQKHDDDESDVSTAYS